MHFLRLVRRCGWFRVDDLDVPDPIGSPLEHYQDCAKVILENITKRLEEQKQ